MGTDHGGARSGFGPQRAVSLLVACAVRLRHMRAVGLAVLVVRMLLAGWTPQTFIHFILIVRHWWIVADDGRVLVIFGDASRPRASIYWRGGAAIELPHDLSGLLHGEARRCERRVETSFLQQRQRADTYFVMR